MDRSPSQPVFTHIFLILVLVLAMSSLQGRSLIPVTGSNDGVSDSGSSSTTFPGLATFAEQVKSNDWSQITGIYVDEHFAFPVVQQPAGDYGFVSSNPDTITQFSSATSFGSIGFLAHDYLAGEYFQDLVIGDVIYIVFGDGHQDLFQITTMRRYQATKPTSPYSDFIDLDNGNTLTASDLFYQTYAIPGQVILQTCISTAEVNSWGRLFVIARPYTARSHVSPHFVSLSLWSEI